MRETMTLWRPTELWVPAEELDEFNRHIVGLIEVVHEFHSTTEPAQSGD